MENLILEQHQQAAVPPHEILLTPSSSGRRSSVSNSPEFEFWMVRNQPSMPQPNLLSADQLFVGGFLLPLHLLPTSDDPPDPNPNTHLLPPDSEPEISYSAAAAALPDPAPLPSGMTASKRWKDIFRKTDRKITNPQINEVKEKKKERKIGSSSSSGNGAELNINIWPFSRSRSAGNGGTKPKMVSGSGPTRKVSSAPCSRSNSAGESKSRKWPSSPSRGGVHLGRSSPVWQIRRPGFVGPAVRNIPNKEGTEARRSKPAGTGAGGPKAARVLNLNVPMCIGYRQHLSCRSENSGAGVVGGAATVECGSGEGGRGSNMFNLRSLFTKKVY